MGCAQAKPAPGPGPGGAAPLPTAEPEPAPNAGEPLLAAAAVEEKNPQLELAEKQAKEPEVAESPREEEVKEEGNNDGDGNKEPEEEGEPLPESRPTVLPAPPWGRFALLWLCCCMASGLVPGQSVFVELIADAGVFGSYCPPDKKGCKDQYLALTGVFQTGSSLAYMFLAPIGLFFDQWGARFTGTTGAFVCALGMFGVWSSLVGAQMGMDSTTSTLFSLGVLVCDFGAMLNSFCFMGLIWHFPGKQSLVLTLINSTYQVSAFLPLLLKAIMGWLGCDFAPVMLGYMLIVLCTVIVCWLLVPTQQEYYRQAKLVLGMPLPKPPAKIEACKMLKRALDVLKLFARDHFASGIALCFGFAFPSFYGSLTAPYGAELFGSKEDGDRLATTYASATGIVGLAIAPFCGGFADLFGLRIFVVFLGFVQSAALLTCGLANWPAQIVCATSLVLFVTLFSLFISRYLLFYAPPNRYGTVQGVYTLLVMLVSMPQLFISLGVSAALPKGPDAYRLPMWVLGSLGCSALYLYACYFTNHPPPEVPPLLEDDEAELARNFGCGTLEEVMFVTHVDSKGALIKMLATTDPEVMHNLIRRIDTERMMEVMSRQSVEDVAAMMEQGVAEDDEEDEERDQVGELQSPLLQEVKTDSPAEEDASTAAPSTAGDFDNGNTPAGSPSAGGDSKIDRLCSRYLALVNSQDKAGLRTYMLECDVDDMWEVQLSMEKKYSKAERDRMDKAFNKLIPGNDFAKLLRERPELKGLVQKFMKREMDKKLAFMKRKGNNSSS